jgi:hypothetical protein
MKSTDYELLVREIYQQLLAQDEVPNIVVEHDALKQGIATKHQIDVYWEFRLGGLIHRVAVQAKQWARPVDKGELLKFKGVLADLPGTLGVMVTAQGYQVGALDVAATYGIKIQLTHRDDAFTGEYTPFELINQALEREGEFSEWQDEATMSFGGFGLNYLAVGPVRESALDYLDFALAGDGNKALHAVKIMRHLLPNHLNRVGRPSTEHEMEWQHRERERCLRALLERCEQHASPLLRARIYDAIRSATAIDCPLPISEAATAALAGLVLSDAAAVVDAICTDSQTSPFSQESCSQEKDGSRQSMK